MRRYSIKGSQGTTDATPVAATKGGCYFFKNVVFDDSYQRAARRNDQHGSLHWSHDRLERIASSAFMKAALLHGVALFAQKVIETRTTFCRTAPYPA
jgi:hypothetical protein